MRNMKTPPAQCPVALTARVMSGKWKPRILYVLLQNEKLRFSELRRECPPISDRMLSLELKELEEWGLIDKEVFPVVPPKTEYTMTTYGRTLDPVMKAMADWAKTMNTTKAEDV